MKRLYILFILLASLGLNATAQTLAQAKVFYQKGEYEKAKPVFKRYVKAQPANGNYNLWYGVCCLKTGEPEIALKHIQVAVKKRITSGQLYLAQTYDALFRYEEAISTYEEYISELEKRKRSTEQAEALLEKSRNSLRLLKGVEEVCFIDSLVADEANFLSAYKLSPELGKLFMYDAYFSSVSKSEGTVYETELGNKNYYSEKQKDGTYSILTSNKMLEQWGKGALLPENINANQNAGFPYMATDGITFYYAADGEGSMGGYDIFVTRYNSSSNSYLTPENIGMPFNSEANDYMYVIDEYNNLGWFATDRNQPEGKVCIYIFIPNKVKQVYDYESIEQERIIRLATLHSIKDTWANEEEVRAARKRIPQATDGNATSTPKKDFVFIIDDRHTYHTLEEFQSEQARKAYEEYAALTESYNLQSKKLENLRAKYLHSQGNERKQLSIAIRDLEGQLPILNQKIIKSEKKTRKLESETFKKD